MPKTERRVHLPTLHDAQRQVMAEAKRFNVLACGRRWGKTTLGVDLLVEPALRGFPVAWFAPTYKMLYEPWTTLKGVLHEVIVERSEQMHRLRLLGGGIVDCWSLDDENAGRGRAYKRVFIDEAGFIKNLEQAWHGAIYPTLTDHHGDAFFGGTPKGMNYYFTLFNRATYEPNEWRSWQFPTSTNSKLEGLEDEIRKARATTPQLFFEQEYEAKFIADGAGVFRQVMGCATAAAGVEPYLGTFVMGVDWGMSNDFTVLTVMDAETGRVVAFDRFNQIDWHIQRSRIAALYHEWRVTAVLVEKNSMGNSQASELRREGIPVQEFVTSNATKATIVQQLALAMEQGKISYPPLPELVGELQAFQSERLPGGMVRYSAPEGMHDDCVISLALAFHATRGQLGENDPWIGENRWRRVA